MNSDKDNKQNEIKLKVQQIQERVRAEGMSFDVGDTGILDIPLKQLTGGKKMEFSKEKAEELKQQTEKLESEGLLFPKPENKPISALSINPPFDWQTQIQQPSFDWRHHRTVTSPRFQRTCGACWAFAAAGMMEMFTSVFFKRVIDVSEQDIINCATGGCGGGFLYHALKYLKDTGAAAESAVPYQSTEIQCNSNVTKCYSVNWHFFLDDNWDIPSLSRMKEGIYAYGGAGTYIIATDIMLAHKGGGVYDEYATSGEDHFVLVIGWDDNKPHRKGKGAWLIKNSWGTDWGQGGFGWVPYDANKIGYNAQVLVAKNPKAGCP